MEPVIISLLLFFLHGLFRYTNSWYTQGIPSDWSDLTGSQCRSFLSLGEIAWSVLAREIEESTITSMFNENAVFTRFPAHRSVEEGTEDLPYEVGA